jgi:hypothetical protein
MKIVIRRKWAPQWGLDREEILVLRGDISDKGSQDLRAIDQLFTRRERSHTVGFRIVRNQK